MCRCVASTGKCHMNEPAVHTQPLRDFWLEANTYCTVFTGCRLMMKPHLVSQNGELARISCIVIVKDSGFAGSCGWCLNFLDLQGVGVHRAAVAICHQAGGGDGVCGVQCKSIRKPEGEEAITMV